MKRFRHGESYKILRTLIIILIFLAGWWSAPQYVVSPDSLDSHPTVFNEEEILTLLKSRDSAIKAVLGDGEGPYSDSQKERLMVLINEIMDFSEMSKTALKGYWEDLNEGQRTEFVAAFSELVKVSSVKKLDIFHAVIEYGQINVEGKTAKVLTRATYKRTRTNVDYDLYRKDGGWFVADFSIDAVSTADSYQKSFQRIIRKHGFTGLMERLHKKLLEERG